jgi:hypothetical protein
MGPPAVDHSDPVGFAGLAGLGLVPALECVSQDEYGRGLRRCERAATSRAESNGR